MLQFRSIAALGCIAAFAAGGAASRITRGRIAGSAVLPAGSVKDAAAENGAQPATGAADPISALLLKSPTLENRLQLLQHLQAAVKTSPEATLVRMEGLTESEASVWTPREAQLAFWSVWAVTDLEAAWHAAEQRGDAVVLNAVAAALVEKDPHRVLDSPELTDWHRLAKSRLLEKLETPGPEDLKDPAMALHWLRTRPVSVAALETVFGSDAKGQHPLAARLMESDRGKLIELIESGVPLSKQLNTALQGALFFRCRAEESEQVLNLIARTAEKQPVSAAQESMSASVSVSLYFSKAVRRWSNSELSAWLDGHIAAGPDTIFLPKGSAWLVCFQELAQRDPAALIPLLPRLPQGFQPYLRRGTPEYPLTAESAAAAKQLIDTAPAGHRASLLRTYLPLLQTFDLPFAAAQVERTNRDLVELRREQPKFADLPMNQPVEAASLALAWVRQDPGAATEWLVRQPESVNLTSAVSDWSGADPEACSGWLNTLPAGDTKDSAIRGLVEGIRWHDPEMAAEWAAQAGSDSLRQKLKKQVEEVVQTISPGDP